MKIKLLKRFITFYKKMIYNARGEHLRVGSQYFNADIFQSEPVNGPEMSKDEQVCPDDWVQIWEFEFGQKLKHGDPVQDDTCK